MGLPLKLFHAIAPNKLVFGPNSAAVFNLPDFVSGGTIAVEYQALLGQGAPYEIVPVAGYSGPQIGIYSLAGVQLAFQNTFTADGTRDVYTAMLGLNDAAMTAAVAALTADGLDASGNPLFGFFTIAALDSSGNTIHLPPQPVRLWKGLITPGATTVAPPDVAATQAWAVNTFLAKNGDGTPRIEKSRSGATTWLVWRDDDGIEQKQNIT